MKTYCYTFQALTFYGGNFLLKFRLSVKIWWLSVIIISCNICLDDAPYSILAS